MNARLRAECWDKSANASAVNAIAYATRYHSDWFWKGAQHIRKWRGKVH
jgi:hypothetical protein